MFTSFNNKTYEYKGKCWTVHWHHKDRRETGTLKTGKEPANKDVFHCVCQLREEKMAEKPNPHKNFYPLTTKICLCRDVNNLWSPTGSENAHIYMVFFIQRIPRYFINCKCECSLCKDLDVLHTPNPVPNGQNLPLHLPHHWIFKYFCQVTIFCLKKKSSLSKVYNLRYLSSNICCISPTHLPSPTNRESEFN